MERLEEAKGEKKIKWALVAFIWMFALSCAYVGAIFLFLGPMMGARGDIDYDAFNEAEKRRADIQAIFLQLFGLITLILAGLVIVYSARLVDFLIDTIFKVEPKQHIISK